MRSEDLKLASLGFITGFISAFLGIGGGVILVPALVILLAFPIKQAVVTSLTVIPAMALTGIAVNFLAARENIRLDAALLMVVGSIVGARIGALLVKKVHSDILKILFACLMITIGLKQAGIADFPLSTAGEAHAGVLWLVALGLAAGISSAFFGIGGGVIMVPALNLFFGLPMHHAIATSLTVIFPTSLAGAFFHGEFNNVRREAIMRLVPLSLAGAAAGAFVSINTSAEFLHIALGILMILCAIKLFIMKKEAE